MSSLLFSTNAIPLMVILVVSSHAVMDGGGFSVVDGTQRTESAEEIDVNRAEEVSVPTGTGDVPTWTVTEGVAGVQFGIDVQVAP